jgi:cytochrome c oxidase subunit IV
MSADVHAPMAAPADSPGAASHGTDGHGAGGHAKHNYMTIFFLLVVLTVAEVIVVYLHLPKLLFVLSMIAMALTKAALVAFYFMHLALEKKTLVIVAMAPIIFASILAVGIVPDGTQSQEQKVEMSQPAHE